MFLVIWFMKYNLVNKFISDWAFGMPEMIGV